MRSRDFQGRERMNIAAGRFRARLAESDQDVQAAQRLRYRVFVEEMGAQASAAEHDSRREIDAFDAFCDHLILEDTTRETDDPLDGVIGVYRLLRRSVARAHGGFYTAAEFDLSRLEDYPTETLELGRSCVAMDYRGGSAMQLLWMALAEYIDGHNLGLLFGCASFHGTDMAPLAMPLAYLHHHHLAPEELRARVLPEHYNTLNLMPETDIQRRDAMRAIPALIKGYLRLNGFVGDGAYIDRDFNTVDVCLIMETSRIADRYRKFYTGKTSGSMERILG